MLLPGLFERSGLSKANSICEGHCGYGKDMPSAGQGWQAGGDAATRQLLSGSLSGGSAGSSPYMGSRSTARRRTPVG